MTFNFLKKTVSLFFIPAVFKDPKHRFQLMLACFLVILDISAATFIPYYSKQIVDHLTFNLAEPLFLALLLLGFFWTFSKIAAHLEDLVFFPIVNTVIRDLNYKVAQHIHAIALSDYQRLSIPEIINCARRISLSARSLMKILCLLIIPTTFKLIIATLVILKLGLFGLWLLLAVLLSLGILYVGTLKYTRARVAAWRFSDKVITRLSDSLLNTKIIRPALPFEMSRLKKIFNSEATLWQTVNARLQMIYIAIGLVLGLAITLILMHTIWHIQHQQFSVGDFVLIQGQLIALFLPLKTFALESRQAIEALVDIQKIIALFEIPLEKAHDKPIDSTHSRFYSPLAIELHQATFSYSQQKPILQNTTFAVKKGAKIGIMGASGTGKSSLLQVIAGFFKPQTGTSITHGKIHCILQDFRLFNLSLRENICYGLKQVSTDAVMRVLAQTQLLETLKQMPLGLDTLIGEMGIRLSGGEKQKVALARALLLKPDILLLDETTNALSIAAERSILKIIFSEIPTVILVSHRLSAVASVDALYTLGDGQLLLSQLTPILEEVL
jgi:ABC-type multidrug transport system fused ATPase/permease subunit